MQLSHEERHALMSGMGKLPDEFMRESLSEYYVGSSGKTCDSCKTKPRGVLCCLPPVTVFFAQALRNHVRHLKLLVLNQVVVLDSFSANMSAERGTGMQVASSLSTADDASSQCAASANRIAS